MSPHPGMGRNQKSGLTNRHLAPRTMCKICKCTVFQGDDTVWVTNPMPGIVHKECVQETTTED